MNALKETFIICSIPIKLAGICVLILVGIACNDSPPKDPQQRNLSVYVFDSCEYIGSLSAYPSGSYSDFMAHKGNCRFCTERNKVKLK